MRSITSRSLRSTRPNIIRLIALVLGLFGIAQVYAQSIDALARLEGLPLDTLIQREKTTTDLRVKCVLTNVMVHQYLYLARPEECMRTAMGSLELAEQLKNDTLIARAQCLIGSAFALVNDVNAALAHYNTSLATYERTGDSLAMGFVCKEIAALYRGLGDIEGSLRYMHRALAYGMNPKVRARGMSVMTKCYLELGNLDSALYCAQQADIVKRPGEDPYGYSGYQGNLGAVYAARNEPDLAETYFKRAVAVADSFHLPQPLITAAAGYSKLLIEQGRTAEALALARKGFEASDGVRQPSLIVKAAGALADAFHAARMDDSAFVYSKLCNAYRDTVTNTQNRSQMQNQLFSQELKDREDANLKEEAKAERSHNIQFGIIALIVLTLGIFLLIFSRTAVVGARAIKNLSLIALLLFFEFLNLLLHPLLDKITDHSPLLMLLAMVCIAGLLIPLHHRMEHFITNMLVSKNNRVRLEAAKRTIEELESKPEN